MSQKRFGDWTDHFLRKSKSGLPADEFTFQTGNNFGLDGFQFDEPDNQGPEDDGRLPTTRGLSGLPDGMVVGVEEGLSFQDLTDDSESGLGINLEAMLSEEEGGLSKDASVIDLEWLDPTQGQDPERLPDNLKTLNAIPQLEEAWGTLRRTDGTRLLPNRDKEAAEYEASVQQNRQTRKSQEEVKTALLRAVRRAHYGDSINVIKAELVDTLGDDASRLASAVKILRDEHGLIGNVYIRASAFPGIKNGRWLDRIKKDCKYARYVITDDQAVADKLGMKMVDEIPWKEALAFYRPRLAAAGYRVASEGNPKEILRRAFRVGPEKQPVQETHKPVIKPVVASAEEAAVALKAPRVEAPLPRTAEENAVENKRRAALVQIAKWVRAGKLTHEDALRLHTSSAEAADLLKVASQLVAAVGDSHIYEGQGTKLTLEAQQARQAAWHSLDKMQEDVEAAIRRKFGQYLAHVVKAGLLTEAEKNRIASMPLPVQELERLIAAAVQMARQTRKASLEVPDVQQYVGTAYTAFRSVPKEKFSAEAKKVVADRIASIEEANGLDKLPDNQVKMPEAKPAKKYADTLYTVHVPDKREIGANISQKEFDRLFKWARQKMAEGTMGDELDQMLKARFALPLRKAARPTLMELRARHEGLSGHLYVDSEAYVSASGTTGCESGAAKHRANGIKYVLATSRCNGCVFANAAGVCSQYNKKLVSADELPAGASKAYQDRVLHLANAPEAEVTASMFNPNEFNLRNAPLDAVEVASEPSVEKLGQILFGGMEVP